MKNLFLTFLGLILSFASFAIDSIYGPSSVCVGNSISVADTTTGGTWSSSDVAIASVSGGSASAWVTGVSAGTTIISYTVGGISVTTVITVNLTPTAITGTMSVCPGSVTTLMDAVGGGTWESTNTSVAIASSATGIVTGVSAGTSVIYYTLPGGCYAAATVTVGLPSSISGASSICAGGTITLTDTVSGGVWSSSDIAVGTISAGGIVTGISTGTTTITYTGSGGCYTTHVVTITTGTSAISGPSTVCEGSAIALTDASGGGVWGSSDATLATIGTTSGIVTGVVAGTVIISYTTSCGTVTHALTVNPGVGSITGPSSVCVGGTITLSDAFGGGTWSGSGPLTIGSGSGIVTGVSSGATTISYILSTGCIATAAISVVSSVGAITGTASVGIGGTTTLSDTTSGGTWSSGSGSIATVGASTGVVTGVAAGVTEITYITGGGCYAIISVTVTGTGISAISGSTSICDGSTTTLTDATTGGVWSSSVTSAAVIGSLTGVVTGISPGTAIISYTVGASHVTATVFVYPTPAAITGSSSVCIGSAITLADATPGGTWSSSDSSVATVSASTGVVTGLSAGGSTITYRMSGGCYVTISITVNSIPTVAASSSYGCGGVITLTASGATTYSWSPTTGLSCPSCATTTAPASSVTYVVTGYNGSCSGTATVSVTANRISGSVSFSSTTPDTLDMKVWLIQFSSTDSSLEALDSTLTCLYSGMPYYEFDGVASGNYLVKGKLLYGNPPGASGYVPTYGANSAFWYDATNISHGSGADNMNIEMVYGTVPSGPGFIGGLISSGAGRGTSGTVPAVGMLVYLRDAATNAILTHTYTDNTGAYSFGSLQLGSYVIYPENFDNYTTPSSVISLTTSAETVNNIDFIQHTTSRTITPISTNAVKAITANTAISVYPNPAAGVLNMQWSNQALGNADVTITDVLGREVMKSVVTINAASGNAQFDISGLKNGIYLLTIKSDNICFNTKLQVQQ